MSESLLLHVVKLGAAGKLRPRPGDAALLTLFYPFGRVPAAANDPGQAAWERMVPKRGLVCLDCGATVQGSVRCRKCASRARWANDPRTPEQLSEISHKANAAQTPEKRAEAARKRSLKGVASMTREQRSEAAKMGKARMTPEKRAEAVRKVKASLTPGKRAEAARKGHDARTPEQRSEASRKGHAARTPALRACSQSQPRPVGEGSEEG